jgi:hypothetical protein
MAKHLINFPYLRAFNSSWRRTGTLARPCVFRQITRSVLTIVFSVIVSTDLFAAGVWTQLTNPNPSSETGTMLLLTDGTVIVSAAGGNVSRAWTKLTPDASGNYVHGTWSSIASMGTERLYVGSNVLPSGKVFVLGGEYSGAAGNQNITNTGEIYDPVSNTWSPMATFPQREFGDDPTVVLPGGNVLCGYIFDGRTYLYNPASNTWTQTGTKLRGDASDEETWILLGDGSVLSYDVFSSPASGTGHAQRYIPASGRWVDAGTVPVPLTSNAYGFELGPTSLLPDGRVIQVGANNNTVFYTPSTNAWTRGPSLPTGMGADDAPGAMLPNGHFLIAADTSSPAIFTPPTRLYDFDYTNNSLTDVTPTGTLGAALAVPAFVCRMLVLPNGHMLLSTGSNVIWDYAPTGAPHASWAPTISNITKALTPANTYTLTGTQLTGISEGASYGDDAEMSTNYPIVRLTSATGVVKYARTANWTPGVATGSLVTTVQFTLPSGLADGKYQLVVIANGIASTSTTFRVGFVASNVIAVYTTATKTLTLTGDANADSLTVSFQGGNLKVEGANGTTINGLTSYSALHSGKLILNADLGAGDDSINVIAVDSSSMHISLGPGADKAAFTLSNIQSLTIDGGSEIDTLITASTTIGTLTKTNLP